MRGFKTLLLVGCSFLLLFSCDFSVEESTDSEGIEDYFFPVQDEPVIYVYADENRPVDEKFFRVYRLKNDELDHLVVERFNASFRITEGFSFHLKDDLNVVDHMVVDANGLKRKAHLTKTSYFPQNRDDQAVFVSDFPAHIDSIVGVYASEKKVMEEMDYEILDRQTKAIVIQDFVSLSFVNPDKQDGNSKKVETERIYAKGIGLTEWYTADKRIHFKLQRMLSNEWWEANAR